MGRKRAAEWWSGSLVLQAFARVLTLPFPLFLWMSRSKLIIYAGMVVLLMIIESQLDMEQHEYEWYPFIQYSPEFDNVYISLNGSLLYILVWPIYSEATIVWWCPCLGSFQSLHYPFTPSPPHPASWVEQNGALRMPYYWLWQLGQQCANTSI